MGQTDMIQTDRQTDGRAGGRADGRTLEMQIGVDSWYVVSSQPYHVRVLIPGNGGHDIFNVIIIAFSFISEASQTRLVRSWIFFGQWLK